MTDVLTQLRELVERAKWLTRNNYDQPGIDRAYTLIDDLAALTLPALPEVGSIGRFGSGDWGPLYRVTGHWTGLLVQYADPNMPHLHCGHYEAAAFRPVSPDAVSEGNNAG